MTVEDDRDNSPLEEDFWCNSSTIVPLIITVSFEKTMCVQTILAKSIRHGKQ
jgi:hypothetical protein